MDDDRPGASAGFSAADRFGDDYTRLLLEQYKLFVGTSDQVSERRAGAHTLLLTTNTLIVSVYSLAVGKDVALVTAGGVWRVVIPLAGIAMTAAWLTLIRSYRALNTAKFSVIDRMEERLPVQAFRLEWEALKGDRRRHVDLSTSERVVPVVFGCLYVAIGLSAWLR